MPSIAFDDRPGRNLFRVLKRLPISQPHALGLRRSYSDGKAGSNTTVLRIKLYPHWRDSLLQLLCQALGQTEANSKGTKQNRPPDSETTRPGFLTLEGNTFPRHTAAHTKSPTAAKIVLEVLLRSIEVTEKG